MKRALSAALFLAILTAALCLAAPVAGAAPDDPVLVAFGDSIAAAGKWQSAFRSLSGETVLNAGVSGNTSSDGLKRMSDVKSKQPDVVFIGFGTNDASIDMSRYVPVEKCVENLKTMIVKVREYGAVPVLIVPPPVVDGPYLTRHEAEPFEPYGGPNGLMAVYAKAIRALAAEMQVTIADVNAEFLSRDYVSLSSDGVHPTDQGYKVYGEVVLEAYRKATVGDVSLDNQVNSSDYMMLKRSLLGKYEMSRAQKNRADVDGNGKTEGRDYMMLKRAILRTYAIDRGVPDPASPGGLVVRAELIPDSMTEEDMAFNTKELQACVDRVSLEGGGTVTIASGTFYFSSQGMNARKYEDYVCMPKDNVTVQGAGESTVLQPVGHTRGGLDMFYFNEYADSGFTNPKYLVNADFRDFVIDGILAVQEIYTSAGKGFMFNLFKDCDFDHVVCKNTDGTGFGVDCPINCTITNCRAYGCGKGGNTGSYGASGFGIGTGYSEDECILIDNCYAEGNMKFGFFFEHQGRFTPYAYPAKKLGSCVVSNCTAKNNFNDFGGELALDLVYVDCVVPEDTTSKQPIAFRQHCIRCRLENMDVRARFTDVKDPEQYYYAPVYWAVNNAITTGMGEKKFGINGTLTKGQALTFLYRIAGMPGDLILGNAAESAFYDDSLSWGLKTGIAEGDSKDTMNDPCSRTDFVTYIWRYAGSPFVSGEYSPAVNWAIEAGLMDTVMETDILRRDAVTLLYRYFGPDGNG